MLQAMVYLTLFCVSAFAALCLVCAFPLPCIAVAVIFIALR